MSSNYKIIFSGPVGAGKTTAITTISDVPTVKTEENASDDIKLLKESTTVALDYGVILLNNKTRIHLYGTPGQKRFNFMWDILTKGSIGLLLLIDGSSKEALNDLKYFLVCFEEFISNTSVVIGITKHDKNKIYDLNEYRQIIGTNHPLIPIWEIDARNKKDIARMIKTLLYTLDPKLTV